MMASLNQSGSSSSRPPAAAIAALSLRFRQTACSRVALEILLPVEWTLQPQDVRRLPAPAQRHVGGRPLPDVAGAAPQIPDLILLDRRQPELLQWQAQPATRAVARVLGHPRP